MADGAIVRFPDASRAIGLGSERRPSGRLFRFQLGHGPMFRSIGCPVFRVEMEVGSTELRGQMRWYYADNCTGITRLFPV